jgi:excisionase family DNA binding protein
MAGRFLSLEEAAQKLGVSADDVQRLVDRKKLYPIRDGSGLKFKTDDLDQYLREQEEEAGTSDDLVAQPEVTAAVEAVPLELDPDPEDSLTLDVEAVVELEPASVIEAEPASVVAIDEPLSAIELADEPAAPAGGGQTSHLELALDLDAPSEVAAQGAEATPAPVIEAAPSEAEPESLVLLEAEDAAGSDVIVLADSGRLSLDRDDLELESIIAASAPSLPVADEPAEEGTLSIDLGEPILGDPLASDALDSPAASLVLGSDADLVVGSNAASGKVGSALSDVLDSGVLIEEKAVELEGIQTWDEVDLGIEEDEEDEEEQGSADFGDDAAGVSLGGGMGGGFDNEDFNLGAGDESGSINLPADASEASDLFPSGVDPSGLSGQSFGSGMGMSGSLELPGDMVADVRFSTWQICGLVCCSLILLTGGIVAFDLVRTIGSPQGTALANPLLDALAETFGWR